MPAISDGVRGFQNYGPMYYGGVQKSTRCKIPALYAEVQNI